jgi:histidinol phosphatase-like PHP family hydrolase
LEISARKGHSLTNGHVARLAKEAGARLIVDSDSHTDSDLLTDEFALKVLRGAGVDEADTRRILDVNPEELTSRVLKKFMV